MQLRLCGLGLGIGVLDNSGFTCICSGMHVSEEVPNGT